MLFWNNDYNACPYFSKYESKNAAWTFTWQQAGAFAQQEGIQVLWQMNAAIGLVCGADAAAKLAASFVTTATAAGVEVSIIEVGNENYGKWEVPYADKPQSVSAAKYAAVCTAVSKAVKAVNASVAVGCVGDLVDPTAPNTPFANWNEVVLNASAADMDFLIVHEYYTKVANGDVSVSNLLKYGCAVNTTGPNCGPVTIADRVKADVDKYAPERQTPLPIMLSEYNMEQPFQKETWSLLEGIFVAKHLGDTMQAGLMGSTFFALANGKTADYGMFSRDANPIAYAPVFSFAIYSRVAPVGSSMLSTSISGTSLGISAYAYALPEANYYGMVLVNTGTTSVNVSLSGPWDTSTDLAATIYTLTASSHSGANSYAATSFAFNNVSGPAVGGPFPLDKIAPKRAPYTGSVVLAAVSVTGFVITPSASPFPPPTPAPPPPPPTPTCCHASCNSGTCHVDGFCVQSQDNCQKHCDGVWCPA
jgi:hypothetical protein